MQRRLVTHVSATAAPPPPPNPNPSHSTARSRNSEAMQRRREAFAAREVPADARKRIARVCQCVALLRSVFSRVSPTSITRLYELGISRGLQAKDLLADEGMRVAAMEA